jgi:hypothetical protein
MEAAMTYGMTKTLAPLLLGATLALASPAMANQIHVGYAGSAYGPYQEGSGGEFTLNDIPDDWLDLSGYVEGTTSNFGPAGITSFQSFCLERFESIVGNTTYDASLAGQTTSGDPLSQGTAFLYQQFAMGTLAGYSYDDGDNDFTDAEADARRASALLLQNAFWWLENEIWLANPVANPFLALVAAEFGSVGNGQLNANLALYGVQVLQLRTLPNFGDAQDVLFFSPARVPDGGTTLALMGFALLGIAILARRFGPGTAR